MERSRIKLPPYEPNSGSLALEPINQSLPVAMGPTLCKQVATSPFYSTPAHRVARCSKLLHLGVRAVCVLVRTSSDIPRRHRLATYVSISVVARVQNCWSLNRAVRFSIDLHSDRCLFAQRVSEQAFHGAQFFTVRLVGGKVRMPLRVVGTDRILRGVLFNSAAYSFRPLRR
jgi:hypothetical protein